ncbi:hypothetical protein GPALN_005060 [Globodera pallida]|nr:hypothetical protein GPALN_005060 [Globodera pallida]
MQRSDKMWLAIDITSHFLRKDDPAELFDCITTIRDPTKLCPLWAFVSAILSRLSADFVTIRGSQKWHSEVAHALMNLDAEFSDVALTKQLYAFALKLSWLLEFARPRGQIKGRLNCLADQKWPSRMEFHEKFSNLVSQFSEHLHNEMPQIALEKHLLRSTDICKAWLYWYYEQQKGTTTETLPLDDADVEFQCENKQNL